MITKEQALTAGVIHDPHSDGRCHRWFRREATQVGEATHYQHMVGALPGQLVVVPYQFVMPVESALGVQGYVTEASNAYVEGADGYCKVCRPNA